MLKNDSIENFSKNILINPSQHLQVIYMWYWQQHNQLPVLKDKSFSLYHADKHLFLLINSMTLCQGHAVME